MIGRVSAMGTSLGICLAFGCFITVSAVSADEILPQLRVGNQVYTNVTVTEVTATDIYFRYAQGMGNAKLKKLDPAMQKHFHFDAAKAAAVEREQREANAQFRAEIAARKTSSGQLSKTGSPTGSEGGNGDITVPTLYARSFLGHHPPPILIQKWLTPAPNVDGKFVLIDFWATWCGPCRRSIPHLNDLAAKFKDRLVVIGLSNESAETVRKMKSPKMDYYVGVDPLARTMKAVGVRAIPHSILIDPHGIVRFEGIPSYLTESGLSQLMAEYSN